MDLLALEMRLGGPLPGHAEVIRALIAVRQALERLDGFFQESDLPSREPIGHGEPQNLEGILMRRIHREHIVTDALGFFRLVEIAVVRRFDDCGL
jgi:hypothetical protein